MDNAKRISRKHPTTEDGGNCEGFSEEEQAVITARNLAGEDGIAGQGISNQKLWAISEAEWDTIKSNTASDTVLSYRSYFWWLRSPHSNNGYAARQGLASGMGTDNYYVYNAGDYFARPA